MHISGLVRRQLRVSGLWKNQKLYIISLDIKFAFDSMRHDVIYDSLVGQGVSMDLAAAILRELSFLKANITVPGMGTSREFPYEKGGRRGQRNARSV